MPSAFERALQAQRRSDFTSRFSNLPSSLGGRTTTPSRPSAIGPTPENLRRLLGDPDPGTGGSGGGGGGDGGGGGGGGGLAGSNNGITNQSVFQYNSELPALTPQQQELLASRRRMATRQFGETEATATREMDRARGDSLRQQGNLESDQRVASREGMATLAGRGVGRSPMFVNPFQRRLADRTQRQTGELQSNLAGILANLEGQIRQGAITRDREYQQIDWDRTSFRSDPSAFMGG